MNTKFIKVSVEEILPLKEGFYFTNRGRLFFYGGIFKCLRTEETIPTSGIECWLEEFPDREAEMLEILSSIVSAFESDYVVDGEIVDSPYEWLQDRYKDAKKLIQEATTLK